MNPYKILGVAKSATASEIKYSFLLKAKILHPDCITGSDEKFKELMEAYSALQKVKSKSKSTIEPNDFSYRNIVKKYERPSNQQRKYSRSEETTEKKYQSQGIPKIAVLLPCSILVMCWAIGCFNDRQFALDFQDNYIKNSSKIDFPLYESSSSSNNKIRF